MAEGRRRIHYKTLAGIGRCSVTWLSVCGLGFTRDLI